MIFNYRRVIFKTLDFLRENLIRRNIVEIENTINSDHSTIKAYQKRKIVQLLEYSVNNVPYYNNLEQTDISDFPVIDKNIYKKNIGSFCSDLFKTEKLYKTVTSGSTGTPFVSYQTKEKRIRNTADTIFFSEEVFFSLGQALVYMKIWNNVNKKNIISQFIQNIIPVNVLNLSDRNISELLKKLTSKKTISILGYSSALEAIARYIERDKIRIGFTVNTIISMSEALDSKTKKLIENAFDCKVYSRYSNVENGILAQQCNKSDQDFVINSASYYIEILKFNSDYPVKDGGIGRIVVTDLFNYGMPFIRYDTGDIGAKTTRIIKGKEVEVFTKIEGRKMDAIFNTKGELISSFTITNSMWSYEELDQYQFIQVGSKEYLFRLNVKKPFLKGDKLIKEFREYLGNDALINIEYVDEIPLLDSGKRKKVMNLWIA